MIAQMRELGYDQCLRADQSMVNLILSRARRQGSDENGFHITFCYLEEGMYIYHNLRDVNENESLHFPEIKLTPDVIKLLDQLKDKPLS